MSDSAESLARSRKIVHPSGITVTTPLLVPSFSSKGFRLRKGEESEVRYALDITSEWLTELALVSAYDLHHGHIPKPSEMSSTPELFVVDSGGYEKQIDHDLSTAVHWPHEPLEWNQDLLIKQLDTWPERFAATFVSYDEPTLRVPVATQVDTAKNLFDRYPAQLHTFLLKPETKGQRYLTHAIQSFAKLNSQHFAFDFIGVTEKELGSSLLDRMHSLARLRITLDSLKIESPIHVFGSLDPLTCILYFVAGAEVFDGLTWLRYAFRDGLCIYQSNYGALTLGLDTREDKARARILTDNVHYLTKLAGHMRMFTLDRNFDKFPYHGQFIRNEFDLLRAKLRGDN